jgi:multidrug efflux pump subunit AcrA (membrane-fusion protein)
VAILGAGGAVFVGLGRGRMPQPQQKQSSQLPAVEVALVQEHQGGLDFRVDGVVIPFRTIAVPAEVSGRVSFKSDNCRVGHVVRKGELLVRIDPQNYELEVRRLEEDVKQARANLHELKVETAARQRQIELAEEDLAIKRREVERYEKIQDPGVYSKSELDDARLKELQARDAVQTEKDQLDLLEARHERLASAIELGLAKLEQARLDLKRTEITAPIDGVITEEGPEQGGYVPIGGTVATVQDTSRMEIRCSLHMQQMNWLWKSGNASDQPTADRRGYQLPETPATVFFSVGETAYRWDGKLAYYDGAQVDQQTRMVPCRVVVEDPEHVRLDDGSVSVPATGPITLMAGMFVTVHVHATPKISLLEFPEVAIQPGNHVWIVRRDADAEPNQGRLRRSSIRIAHAADDLVLAYDNSSDLKPGDLVVVSPLASPTENSTVELMEMP